MGTELLLPPPLPGSSAGHLQPISLDNTLRVSSFIARMPQAYCVGPLSVIIQQIRAPLTFPGFPQVGSILWMGRGTPSTPRR